MAEKKPVAKTSQEQAPIRKAVALRYDSEQDAAPKIIAKGQRLVAERILDIARENKIHIQEDPELLGMLATLDPGSEVPEELFQAVAEVLAFVYKLNKRMGAAS